MSKKEINFSSPKELAKYVIEQTPIGLLDSSLKSLKVLLKEETLNNPDVLKEIKIYKENHLTPISIKNIKSKVIISSLNKDSDGFYYDQRQKVRFKLNAKCEVEKVEEYESKNETRKKIEEKLIEYINKYYNSNFNSSNRMTNQTKPISVNSNNNYLVLKLKKEIENLKSQLSKQEMNKNNEKFKQIENKIIQKKLNDNLRINKNIINNNKDNISKDNVFSFANNTFTNNFYNLRDSKNKPINNNHSINQINDININLKNYNKIIFNHNTMSTNSFISNSKINLKNKTFRTKSNDKAKNDSKKIIYDKNKYIINSDRDFNFKKIYGKKNNFNKNIIEIILQEEIIIN